MLFENSGLWVSGDLLLVYFQSEGEQAENALLLYNISDPVNVQLKMEINLTDGLLTYNSDFIFTLSGDSRLQISPLVEDPGDNILFEEELPRISFFGEKMRSSINSPTTYYSPTN